MKIAVLGAGVSGLAAARLLHGKGYEVKVFEKESRIGGLARSRFTSGRLYDPYGGHILNSKDKSVMEFVFSLLPRENWQYTERNAKIWLNGSLVSYPFELALHELDQETEIELLFDLLMADASRPAANFRQWLYNVFGKGIAEAYMIPYNEKIWAYPLEKMETRWMAGKMPVPDKKEILRSALLRDAKERKMPHSTFYYPLHGGIQSMVDAMAEGLDIETDGEVKKIEAENLKWRVNGEEAFDHVISTIPLPVLKNIMRLPRQVDAAISGLKWNSLTTALFDCPKTDITWLYIPSHKYRSHRVGYQSALTPYATPCVSEKGCAALEIIGPKFPIGDNFAQQEILPPELGFKEVLDSEFTEYAYVIHDLDYRKNTEAISAYFDGLPNFSPLGRWGKWNYKNMDLCIQDAMRLVGEKF